MSRLHFTADYRRELSELMDTYNDERPRMPYLYWMVRSWAPATQHTVVAMLGCTGNDSSAALHAFPLRLKATCPSY